MMVTTARDRFSVTPLTALDISGIGVRRISEWAYGHACPRCGSDAWSGRSGSQCINENCDAQFMAPLDVVAEYLKGDYIAAEERAAKILRRTPNYNTATQRHAERRVLDFWVTNCLTSPSSESSSVERRLDRDGRGLLGSRFTAAVIGRAQMAQLVRLAAETGATFPQGWMDEPPAPCGAFCVQTRPHVIDRIVLLRKGDTDFTWNLAQAGITGLIGLVPDRPRFLASNIHSALALQNTLAQSGHYEEVASVFLDPWCAPVVDPWRPDAHLLTAVPENTEDLVRIQSALDSFPEIEEYIRAAELGVAARYGARCQTSTWEGLRVAYISSGIRATDKSIPPAVARLYERTGSRLTDASKIITRLKRAGQFMAAEDFHRLTENRVLFKDHRIEVRETADEYFSTTHSGRSQVANFTLRLTGNVRFRDRSDTYCRGVMRCGNLKRDVVFRHSLLSGKATRLQEELHNHLITPGEAVVLPHVPTIIDTSSFQKYVIPSLNRQLADLPMTEGISRVGWSADRKTFHAPGMTVGADGRTEVPAVFYPGVLTLRAFAGVESWADACPTNLHPVCQDLISVFLALTVRYYNRCLSPPLCVLQTSDSVAVLEGLLRAVGQTTVFDMGANVRDVTHVDGVNGYPFLASGYGRAQLAKSNLPYVVLTDEGYRVEGSPDVEQIEAGGRALQFALIRVVEWCLATGADDFREIASVDHHVSLMKEGQWLMRNACDLQPWEVSVQSLEGLEHMLSQIPAADTKSRMTLTNGVLLTIDLSGIDWDAAQVTADAASFGAEIGIDGDTVSAPAAALLPAMARFYGAPPDVSLA